MKTTTLIKRWKTHRAYSFKDSLELNGRLIAEREQMHDKKEQIVDIIAHAGDPYGKADKILELLSK